MANSAAQDCMNWFETYHISEKVSFAQIRSSSILSKAKAFHQKSPL